MMYIKKKDYPQYLKEIYSPPERLYFRGRLEILHKQCLSIVGTRKNSEYGEYMTKKIIEELSVANIAIVSGLAFGIDSIAHQEALKNDLDTIAVLGSGIDNIYPKGNLALAQRISKKGLIISEYPNGVFPAQFHFPARNRIVSGLSSATLVVEAPEKSGALITARFALEQGREVFVVPGDVHRKNSTGILKLMQRGGAYPVESGYEIMEILDIPFSPPEQKRKKKSYENLKLNETEKKVFLSISKFRKTSLKNVLEKSGLSIAQVLSTISILELKGLINLREGKYLRKI